MNKLASATIFFVSTILIAVSCKKQISNPPSNNPAAPRKIQFSLYTDKDFSSDNDTITFTLFMQNSKNENLWDSMLAPMQIKDIPSSAHKLTIEKLVPYNDNSLLKVGFRYSIENVGTSWYFDSSSAGETFKIVNFNFQ
jgi:hypothetical protein